MLRFVDHYLPSHLWYPPKNRKCSFFHVRPHEALDRLISAEHRERQLAWFNISPPVEDGRQQHSRWYWKRLMSLWEMLIMSKTMRLKIVPSLLLLTTMRNYEYAKLHHFWHHCLHRFVCDFLYLFPARYRVNLQWIRTILCLSSGPIISIILFAALGFVHLLSIDIAPVRICKVHGDVVRRLGSVLLSGAPKPMNEIMTFFVFQHLPRAMMHSYLLVPEVLIF